MSYRKVLRAPAGKPWGVLALIDDGNTPEEQARGAVLLHFRTAPEAHACFDGMQALGREQGSHEPSLFVLDFTTRRYTLHATADDAYLDITPTGATP